MKASEFVKKFGWKKVQEGVKNSKPHETYLMGIYSSEPKELDNVVYIDRTPCQADIAELKRLVASHELVKTVGGIEVARNKIKVNAVWCDGGSIFLNTLKQAILDVESCQ